MTVTLVAAMLAALIPAADALPAGGTFSDDNGNVHESYIEAIAAIGITNGCNPPANDRFCPARSITRGELAVFLTRAKNLPPTSTDYFTDDDGSPFESAINSVAAADITFGCNPPANDRFCPDAIVSRGQMAAMLVRAFGYNKVGKGDWFKDDDGSVFETDIDRLRYAGKTYGCNPPVNDRFCPDDNVRRDEMASLLGRALKLNPIAPPAPPPPPGGYDITVKPGDNVQSMVNSSPSGTSFYFQPGVYRLIGIQPKDGDRFVGAPGAVLNGSKVLTSFGREGAMWVASNQTQGSSSPREGEDWGYCNDGYDACVYPEQLLLDGVQLWQVSSKSRVGPGKWYFDYGANKIYMGDNPSGRLVETSVTTYAFYGSADNVTIEGFVIEKYASPGRQGTINPRVGRIGAAGTNWTIKNNTVQANHGYGIKIEKNMTISGNTVAYNGHMGIGGVGDNTLVADNTISYNCTAGFKCFGHSGGGLKIDKSNNVILRGNYVYKNAGHGLHMDVGSTNMLIEDNVVVDNEGAGIHVETSASAMVRGNTVTGNGFRTNGSSEPGILVISSKDVEVTGNIVTGNSMGIFARQDNRTTPYKLTGLSVHHNRIEMSGSARTGISVSGVSGSSSYFTSKNNKFRNNDYIFKYDSSSFKPFKWNGSTKTVAEWKNAGNDTGGTFTWK